MKNLDYYSILIIAITLAFTASCDVLNAGTLPGPTRGTMPTVNTPAAPDNLAPEQGDNVTFSVGATDPQGDTLAYAWDDGDPDHGEFTGTGDTVVWTTDEPGTYTITVTITDGDGNSTTSSFTLTVAEPGAVVITTDPQTGYVGKQTCLGCHRTTSVDEGAFDTHRHNHKLNPATSGFIGPWWTGSNDFDGVLMDFTSNGSYTATIAGTAHTVVRALGWGINKWKQRYIVNYGNSWYITPAQHNVVTDEWVNYHASDWDAATGLPTSPANSYDRRCAGCHTTGTNVQFSNETDEWVMGYKEENVQCEACHGPGEAHAGSPSASNIINPNDLGNFDRQVEVCGACHGRGNSAAELGGKTMGYPFSAAGSNYRPGEVLADYYEQAPGLWPDGHSKKHHQQYNDYLLSGHYASGSLTCWTCHNAHEPDAAFSNDACTSCHADKAASDLAEHTQHATALQCIDCHMPFTAKSAIAYDVRSHAFDIIPPQTSLDNLLADPENVMPNSCMNGACHPEYALTSADDLADKQAEFDSLFGEGEGIHTPAQAGYVGKSTCITCHSGDVALADFNDHRHNHKLNPATDEFIGAWWTGSNVFDTIAMDFNVAGGVYSANIAGTDHEIVRALGWGYLKWKQRYIVKYGNSWYITPAQHNMVTDEWVNYHTGDWDDATGLPTGPANSYDRRCAGCHTTGTNVAFYDATGEWVMGVNEENVQCEACHGPGETHAGSMDAADITNPNDIADYDRKIEVCGACHGRGSSVAEMGGSTMGYPFSADGRDYIPGEVLTDFYTQGPGLWPDGHSKKHHQQYNDFLLSGHYGTGFVTCWTCHNVHEPDAAFTNDLCATCHPGPAGDLAAHTNHAGAMLCIDCHMPFTAKSAVAYDVRSHAFDIISPQVSLDNFLADPGIVMPNSCMNGACHSELDLAVQADIEAKLADFNLWWPPS
jgi:hypothetical protein